MCGNDKHPIAYMMGTNGCRRYALPLRIVPDLGKVVEYTLHPPNKEAWDVFNKGVPWSNHPNKSGELRPEAGSFPVDSRLFSGE